MPGDTIKNERGYTLIELVIAIIILGVAFPAIIYLYGSVSLKSAQSSVMNQLVAYAEEKMETIIGYKETHWDWYKDVSIFNEDEDLGDGYSRRVRVTKITGWGNAGIDAWQINVKVTHPQVEEGYSLTLRLTKYYEKK